MIDPKGVDLFVVKLNEGMWLTCLPVTVSSEDITNLVAKQEPITSTTDVSLAMRYGRFKEAKAAVQTCRTIHKEFNASVERL